MTHIILSIILSVAITLVLSFPLIMLLLEINGFNKKEKNKITAKTVHNYKKTNDVLIFNEPKRLGDVIKAFDKFIRKPDEWGKLDNLFYVVFITQHSDKDEDMIIKGFNKSTFDLII